MLGAIYGIDRQVIQDKFYEILVWAELERSTTAEFRTLSSGMKTRLAFSVIRHIEAEVFLYDEVLQAADHTFQEKCRDFFVPTQHGTKTVLMVSHDLQFVREFCSQALWLHQGQLRAYGAATDVVEHYQAHGRKG